MGFLKWLIILIFQFYLTIAQPNFTFQSPCEGNVTEYPPNDSDGFYNATIGQDQDRVSAIASNVEQISNYKHAANCIKNATA
ncbi:hypothetical protein H5410_008021 [Solanum commersonii]|uniref:Uncharacterized protein n=1 Tax=Solanum commersonii TaxID=4109 RepID=A0A9J6AEI8_SOLCO|nr:hypothetical protein H5410_008021 [Solanum commersonii]